MTPEQWFESLRAQREGRREAARSAWAAQCAELAQRRQEAAASEERAEHDMQWARTQQQYERAEQAQREAVAALREALAAQVLSTAHAADFSCCGGGTD